MLHMRNQLELKLPNPQDWRSRDQAAAEIRCSTRTVERMVDAGVLREYRIGAFPVYWAAQVAEVAAARTLVRPAAAS